MDNKQTHKDSPYAEELAQLAMTLSELDEPVAKEMLEDMIDHAAATASELKSKGKPNTPLKQVMRECGLGD